MSTEIARSSDINVITAEINSYKHVAGHAIFEIGRRLKLVRDARIDSNDEDGRSLAVQREKAGGWIRWLEGHVEFTRGHADRFIKVYERLGDGVLLTRHTLDALYHISTLPPDQRDVPHTIPSTGATKTVDDMTVRELREVKAALKQTEAERDVARQTESTLRDTIEAISEQPAAVEYVRDESAEAELERYKARFGEIDTYESAAFRIPNATDISASIQTFSYEVRGLLKKYAYMTQYIRELTVIPEVVREDYESTLDAISRFSTGLRNDLDSANAGVKIININ